ncbi:helicase DnaB, partial [Staphylococcus argenteus]|nr:helicase DnaB [Staphylococcus argenteus]
KKVNQPKSESSSANYQKRGTYSGQRKRISKEKTPKWLENRDNPDNNHSTAKHNSSDDQQLEQDRQAFLDKLSKKWEEDSQ